ncbi:MAG: hypothetical protein H7318_10405 [Oligoflexus sp.]|nr:hypothetical protein [Oligoflexus sp.]
MSLNAIGARGILRLPLGELLELAQVEQAFHKMIRRYPLEQFPEKFSEIRKAYQVLTDPSADIRSFFFDETLDLSTLLGPFLPMNAKPQNEIETFLFNSLSALLRQNFMAIVDGDYDEDDEFAIDEFMPPFAGGMNELERILEELMGRTDGKRQGRKLK